MIIIVQWCVSHPAHSLSYSFSQTSAPTQELFCTDDLNREQRRTLLFTEISQVSSEDDLNNPDTPQYTAFEWIVGDDILLRDPSEPCPEDSGLEQRYILALLYFATGGDTDWTQCSRRLSVECRPDQQEGQDRWMTFGSVCIWAGVGCVDDETEPIVNSLSFNNEFEVDGSNGFGLTGELPDELFQLTDITFLNFEENDLTGNIPDALFNVVGLTQLDFTSNPRFGGTLSTRIGELTSLTNFDIGQCDFTGTLPDEVGRLPNLNVLRVQGNEFTGTIPQTMGQALPDGDFQPLRVFDVVDNGFVNPTDPLGNTLPPLPPTFSNLQTLNDASFGSGWFIQGNPLTGTIPQGVCEIGAFCGVANVPFCQQPLGNCISPRPCLCF